MIIRMFRGTTTSSYRRYKDWVYNFKAKKRIVKGHGKTSIIKKIHENYDDTSIWWNVEYEKDIFQAMKVSEVENRPVLLMRDFREIVYYRELRSCLVMLQKHIVQYENLSRNALHLGVYLFDVFLNTYDVPDVTLYFVAGVCLILAVKMEDKDSAVPSIEVFDTYLKYKGHISALDYMKIEFNIIQMMSFNMIVPTAVTFVDYFASIVVSEEDFEEHRQDFNTFSAFLENAHLVMLQLLDATLEDPYLVQETPSRVAAACVLATRTIIDLSPIWPKNLLEMTQYRVSDLYECASKIISLCNGSKSTEFSSPDSGYLTTSINNSPGSDSVLPMKSYSSSDESMSVDE